MKSSRKKLAIAAAGIAALSLLTGCASKEPPAREAPPASTQSELAAEGLIAAGDNPTLDRLTASRSNPALEALWSARRSNSKDFAIGPGDVLEIQVPSVKELEDRTVRVDGHGDIDLPLIGTVHVAGLSESELNSTLVTKLGDYLYHPQAAIFVKSYNNRQVSVTGEVRTPADYTLNGPDDTVRELIQRAGGMTQQASPEIVLTPGAGNISAFVSAEAKGKYSVASYDSKPQTSSSNSPPSNDSGSTLNQPLIIDLSRNGHQERYLDLPVRPGDTIFVPLAGSVSTIGWVYRTQTMAITQNLSLMGAVAASGGTMYAADQHNVKILRRQTDGQRAVMTFDIASIQAGKSPDVPLRDGDIVDVSYSAVKIPGYALYYAAQGLVSFAPAALLVSGS